MSNHCINMPNFLYKYPKANPIPPLNKKHRSTINGVSVVIAIVLGRCPAANNKATITFTTICTFSGISLFSMSITFEAIKTSNDIRNNLIIISSVTPPVNKPASIFEMAGALHIVRIPSCLRIRILVYLRETILAPMQL